LTDLSKDLSLVIFVDILLGYVANSATQEEAVQSRAVPSTRVFILSPSTREFINMKTANFYVYYPRPFILDVNFASCNFA